MKNLLLGGSIVAILSIVGIIAIFNGADSTTRGSIVVELAKLLLQILVIVILGGIVKLLIDNVSDERRRADAQNELKRRKIDTQNEFRKKFLGKLIQIYADTKKSRRLLRADKSVVNYNKQMEIINDAQLDLETLEQEIKIAGNIFSHSDKLGPAVKSMAKYLDQLIEEYEHMLPKLNDDSISVSISDLAELNNLIGPYGKSKFREQFVHTYRSALESVQRDILQTGNSL